MRRLFSRVPTRAVAGLQSMAINNKRWCSTEATPTDEEAATWTRDGWVASLPTDQNRAPLSDIGPLLSSVFTPGEMHPKELEVFVGASNMVAGAEQKRMQNKDAPLTDDEKYIQDSPLSTYTRYYPEHHKAVETSVKFLRAKADMMKDANKGQLQRAAQYLTPEYTVIRMLAEHYPKVWTEFIKCEGKTKIETEEQLKNLESEDERALALVCKYFKNSLPQSIISKNGDQESLVLPPHPLESYWAIESIVHEGNLFQSTKSTEVAVNAIAGELHELYSKEDHKFKDAKEIRILDAGCGAGNFGHVLQQALISYGLLKSSKHPNRPDVSIYGFDMCLHVLSFLSASLKNTPPTPGFNLYNANDGKTEPLLCVDPSADRSSFRNAFTPASFDYVVSCDFLMQDPVNAMPGMRTFYDCFDLVKPGGSMMVFDSLALTSPAVLSGYSAALSVGREGDLKNRLLDQLENSSVSVVRLPEQGTKLPDTATEADKLQDEAARIPVFAHTFVKKQ